jgi:hypothetical protein
VTRFSLLALMLVACGGPGAAYPQVSPYTDTVDAAIEWWPGGVSARCADRLRGARLHVAWGQAFMDECGWVSGPDGSNRRPIGAACMRGDDLVVAQPQHPEVWAHEVLHVLTGCELGDLDHGHRSPGVWGRDGLEGRLRELWR